MLLGESEDLISPYLLHPEFKALCERTPRLHELTIEIQESVQKMGIFHPFRCLELPESAEKALLEFADICKEHLK